LGGEFAILGNRSEREWESKNQHDQQYWARGWIIDIKEDDHNDHSKLQ